MMPQIVLFFFFFSGVCLNSQFGGLGLIMLVGQKRKNTIAVPHILAKFLPIYLGSSWVASSCPAKHRMSRENIISSKHFDSYKAIWAQPNATNPKSRV